jgi:uncharacterized RDD family membrane protein YckC
MGGAMERDQFTIASATGVDVTLDVAGAGSRSFAFVIDWHIRTVVALAWFLVASLLLTGHAMPTKEPMPKLAYPLLVLVPAAAIYFLYHPVLEIAMRGLTPGKRMAGVRLVSESGGVPSTGAILIRNIFRLIDSLPMLYLVGLVTTLVTAKRVRIGDLAARTLLINDRAGSLDALADLGARAGRTQVDPQALELAREVLARWTELDLSRRAELARTLLARIDPTADPAALSGFDAAELRHLLEAAIGGETA